VRRDKSGRIRIAGLDFGNAQGGDDDMAADWFFKQHEFVIRAGTLRWIDETRDVAPLALADVQLVIRNGLREHDLRIDRHPARRLGRALQPARPLRPAAVRAQQRLAALGAGAATSTCRAPT
jgi:hypothetical protein